MSAPEAHDAVPVYERIRPSAVRAILDLRPYRHESQSVERVIRWLIFETRQARYGR